VTVKIIIIITNIAPQCIRTQTHLTTSRVTIPLSYHNMLTYGASILLISKFWCLEMYSLSYSLILLFQTIQYSYRFLAWNIMVQTCSPCSTYTTVLEDSHQEKARAKCWSYGGNNDSIQFNSFIYLLDNSQKRPVTILIIINITVIPS
jgi:hypothetical protein